MNNFSLHLKVFMLLTVYILLCLTNKRSVDMAYKHLISGKYLRKFYKSLNVLKCGSRTAATSKMKHFLIIVNSFQSLTVITKSSILDVAAVLDPPLFLVHFLLFFIYLPYFSVRMLLSAKLKFATFVI